MTESLQTIADLFTRPDFLIGVTLGVATRLASTGPRRLQWGLFLAIAVIAAVSVMVTRRLGLLAAIALVAVGGALLDRFNGNRQMDWAGWTVVAAGAVLAALRSGIHRQGVWLVVAFPIVLVATGWALRSWRGHEFERLLPLLFAISAFGVWITVPDTEAPRILLGAALPLLIDGPGEKLGGLAWMAAFALAGTTTWIAAFGGDVRHGSIIAAWAAVGLIGVWPPIINQLHLSVRAVLGLHLATVILVTRVFGLWETALAALIGVAGTALAGLIVASAALAFRRERVSL